MKYVSVWEKCSLRYALPVNWDKGKAVSWLMRNVPSKPPVMPIYIGDDITDEDAFKILKDSGLTVFVGKPQKI